MKWSLQRLKFLLAHIEDFVDNDWRAVQERARDFSAQSGLTEIHQLVDSPKTDPEQIFAKLVPFFDSGLLLHEWKVTDIFWRGSVFHLQEEEQASAAHLSFEATPVQIQRAAAEKILKPLKMEFLLPDREAQGYLLQPVPQVGYILFSNLPEPWAIEHVSEAHRLVNKAFVF